MHSLHKSVDKQSEALLADKAIITKRKLLARKKVKLQYYTAIRQTVNKKLDHRINVCYNSQNLKDIN